MRLDPAELCPLDHPTLVGDLRSWRDVELPGLGRRSEVYVWLPPGYEEGEETYPVLHLHDGDNVFLDERAFGGVSWAADAALATLAAEGLPLIAVAVPCHPTERAREYTPLPLASDPTEGGGAADYVCFLADELVPAVDAVLRTRTEPEHRVVAGSSFGGVVSALAWSTRPDVFGGAGIFSPAWYDGQAGERDRLLRELTAGRLAGRAYVDVGGHEHPFDASFNEQYVVDAEAFVRAARQSGLPVRYLFDSVAYHFEDAWAARLPEALRWLLHGWRYAAPSWVEKVRTSLEEEG